MKKKIKIHNKKSTKQNQTVKTGLGKRRIPAVFIHQTAVHQLKIKEN